MGPEDGFRRLLHGGEGGAGQLIGIDHDIDPAGFELLLRDGVEAGGHHHQGGAGIPGAEALHELEDLRRVLLSGMDHDGVGAGGHEGEGPGQGVLHPLLQDQAFDPGADHEILCPLGALAGGYFFGEMLDGILGLGHLRTEEGILLQAGFILDDHHGDAHALQGPDRIHKMLRQSAGVPVEDDGLGGHLADFVHRAEAGGHVHQLDIRLAPGGGIAEGGDPHGVKLADAAVFRDLRVLDDQAGEAAVGLHGGDGALHGQQLFQPAPAQIRRGQLQPGALLQIRVGFLPGIGELHELSTVAFQNLLHLPADRGLHPGDPVVPVDHIVRAVALQILPIAEGPLLHHLVHQGQGPHQGRPLGKGNQGEALVSRHRLVAEDADDEPAQPPGPAQQGDMPAVEQIRGKAEIDRPVFEIGQAGGNRRQILRGINFGAEPVPDVQCDDPDFAPQPVQGLLGIAGGLPPLAHLRDPVQPHIPVGRIQMIQRLGLQGAIIDVDAHLQHMIVQDLSLEILLRQGKGGRDLHAAAAGIHQLLQHGGLENQVPVHHHDLLAPEQIPGAVDRIDVIGLRVAGIADKGNLHPGSQGPAVIHQHLIIIPGGDDRLPDPRLLQQPQLAGKDGLPGGNLRHALGLLAGERPHPAAHAGIENQRLHSCPSPSAGMPSVRSLTI